MKTYDTMVHLNGHLMAAFDVETTGEQAGYHEIIQIAVVPLGADLLPNPKLRPFYHNIAPKHPERAQHDATRVHGLDLADLMLNSPSSEKVSDLFVEWFEALDLPVNKRLVPLVSNWIFESSFSIAWLGHEMFKYIWHFHPRDVMGLALALKDRAAFAGEPMPFDWVGLGTLCKKYGIVNEKPHDALCDAVTEAKVYRALLQHGLF